MGLFDTVLVEMPCPVCHSSAEREVQFKHEACLMDVFHVGDFVPGAPAGQPLLRGGFTCAGPSGEAAGAEPHHVDCWVHFDRGYLTGVTLEAPERPAPVVWWMLERAGRDAHELRVALEAVRRAVEARRTTLREGVPQGDEPLAALRRIWAIESEEALLERLEGIVRSAEAREWPGGEERSPAPEGS